MPDQKKRRRPRLTRGLKILYEDDDLLGIDKPAGLLTVAYGKNKNKTATQILTDYLRKGCPKSRKQAFTVHRLDQWTSGVLIFAKTPHIMNQLKDNWKDTQKIYIAAVHGRMPKKEGTISSYLAENSAYHVYSTPDPKKGRLAKTAYKVIKETPLISLLEINLITGRKNQIRVHLADKGCPILGDRKYGKIHDPFERLALHSRSISFNHPATNEPLTIESQLPSYFKALMATTPKPNEKKQTKHKKPTR